MSVSVAGKWNFPSVAGKWSFLSVAGKWNFVWLLGFLSFSTLMMMNKLSRPTELNAELLCRLQGPILPQNGQLIQHIRSELVPPSTGSYNLLHPLMRVDLSSPSWHFLNKVIKFLFDDEPPGFFVEAGAMDGDYDSNSLYLERQKGWTGLLVEPESHNFQQLKGRNRKSWLCNCCLSIRPYPHQGTIHTETNAHDEASGKIISLFKSIQVRSVSSLVESKDMDIISTGYDQFQYSQCYPLQSILWALNITRVNLISLDVEGSELEILHNFLMDNIFVDVWLVEHKFYQGEFSFETSLHNIDVDFVRRMRSKGYVPYSVKFPNVDYVFVHSSSPIHNKVKNIWPQEWIHELASIQDSLNVIRG